MFDKCALRDLDVEQLTRDLVLIGLDFFNQIRLPEILAGQIDRNRNDISAPLQYLPAVLADLLDHVKIKFTDQSSLFESRNKLSGGDHAMHRILPAGQGFRSAESSGNSADHRLVVHLDPAFRHCLLIIVQNILS